MIMVLIKLLIFLYDRIIPVNTAAVYLFYNRIYLIGSSFLPVHVIPVSANLRKGRSDNQ